MIRLPRFVVVAASSVAISFITTVYASAPLEVHHGEQLDPADLGPGVIESMDVVIARDLATAAERAQAPPKETRGRWVVPSRRSTYYPKSGQHNLTNKWGDTRMGIGFAGPVTLKGAYFSGQGGAGVWTSGVRAIGFRDGTEVARTEWFTEISDQPAWFEMNLSGVDRLVIESKPVLNGGGWYALDDLTFTPSATPGQNQPESVVLDFEDCGFHRTLSGSAYAGLTWEMGHGSFVEGQGVPAPQIPPGLDVDEGETFEGPVFRSDGGTLPVLGTNFQGVVRGDASSWSYPPDTCGAIGPDHFVETVNRNFAVYNKTTGAQLINTNLGSFLPGSSGDPRVLFDQHSGRWIVTVPDFDTKLFLAVSTTDDPTGSWFKTHFVVSDGSDSGCWPDYPTLGVDAEGIYASSYMVGCGMSIFAIDKAPLIDESPSLGTVTAFRDLTYEGAIQPAHTYGTPGYQFFVSRRSSNSLRVRRLEGPLTSPTLTTMGNVSIPSHSSPPDIPALGSTTPLDTVGHRLMNAVYRDGSIWTAHCVGLSSRAACRWYEINVGSLSLAQNGTISDATLSYSFPTITVNSRGDAVMGFSGASPDQYAACYYTGRFATDAPGEMAPPALIREGNAPQNNLDGYGRNRWGDYSLCSVDPVDDMTFWTVQEYAYQTDIWGTWIAQLNVWVPNDDCTDAAIVDNGVQSGSTTLADPDGDASCSASSSSPDAWFSYTPPFDGILNVDTCGSTFDTVLSVHTGCPGSDDSELGCSDDDDFCGDGSAQSYVSIPVTAGVEYLIRLAGADGASGNFLLTVDGPADTTPPDPDPMGFEIAPAATSNTEIEMTATLATDSQTPPIEYRFDYVTGGGGTGGSDTLWRSERYYLDGGLQTNMPYTYRVKARDGKGNETEYSELATTYTMAVVPAAPVLSSVGGNSMDLAIDPGDNPPHTEFAVRCASTTDSAWDGRYVAADGTASDTATWRTGDDWAAGITILDLTDGVDYCWDVVARNGAGLETEFGGQSCATTQGANVLLGYSCRTHAGAGEICVEIGIGDGLRFTGDNLEWRLGGVSELSFDVDAPVFDFAASVSCAQSSAFATTVTSISDGGTTVTVQFDPALPTNNCCVISFSGGVAGEYAVATLEGSVDEDLVVNTLDFSAIKARFGQSVDASNFRYDVNADGIINTVDSSAVKARFGNSMSSCP